MKREDQVFLAAFIVSAILSILDGVGCLPGLILDTFLHVLMVFPLTMAITFIPYLIYWIRGKKDSFPIYYYLISLIIVTTYMLFRPIVRLVSV